MDRCVRLEPRGKFWIEAQEHLIKMKSPVQSQSAPGIHFAAQTNPLDRSARGKCRYL
jgi:hypothetical protein